MKTVALNTPGSEPVEELGPLVTALADPVRHFLLELLVVDDATAGDLAASAADTWGISPSRASQHLQVLARTGLVRVEAVGTVRLYRRNTGAAQPLTAWLRAVELA